MAPGWLSSGREGAEPKVRGSGGGNGDTGAGPRRRARRGHPHPLGGETKSPVREGQGKEREGCDIPGGPPCQGFLGTVSWDQVFFPPILQIRKLRLREVE